MHTPAFSFLDNGGVVEQSINDPTHPIGYGFGVHPAYPWLSGWAHSLRGPPFTVTFGKQKWFGHPLALNTRHLRRSDGGGSGL